MKDNYIVYRDSSGEFGAVLDTYETDQLIDLWIEGKKVLGNPVSSDPDSAISYVEEILRSRGKL